MFSILSNSGSISVRPPAPARTSMSARADPKLPHPTIVIFRCSSAAFSYGFLEKNTTHLRPGRHRLRSRLTTDASLGRKMRPVDARLLQDCDLPPLIDAEPPHLPNQLAEPNRERGRIRPGTGSPPEEC